MSSMLNELAQPSTSANNHGSLKIVGSGISSAGQFTLETVGLIENADKVFYIVCDPVTEAYIQSKNKCSLDLLPYYDNRKQRAETYVQQVEVILREVRAGHNVVGVFYGHPGVCVLPSYRAMTIARKEGYTVKIYPGVSALDCLFADLEIDPARLGCTVYQARDMLVRKRSIPLSSHLVLLQPWAVGYDDFCYGGRQENIKFSILVDHLVGVYGSQHHVIHYIAALLPQALPIIEMYNISDLYKPEVMERLNGSSTLYLPPKTILPFDQGIGNSLSGVHGGAHRQAAHKDLSYYYFPAVNWSETESPAHGLAYNDHDKLAILALDECVKPEQYRPLSASEPMRKTMIKLATDPNAFDKYQTNPAAVVSSTPGLALAEKVALLSGNHTLIRAAMVQRSADPADQFVQAMLRNPSLAKGYSDILTRHTGSDDSDAITAWIVKQGYKTTAAAVNTAWVTMESQDLDAYTSSYNTYVNSVQGPQITVRAGTVVVDGTTIKLFTYKNSKLSWNATDGNPSSAQLQFVVLMDDDGESLPTNAYIGPQFTGYYWASSVSTKPVSPNIIGRNGAFPPGGGNTPPTLSPAGAPLITWMDTYQAYQLFGTQWKPLSTLMVGQSVSYDGQAIKSFTYTNDSVAWKASDGNAFSAEILFFLNVPTTNNQTAGNQFYGKIWGPNDAEPTNSNFIGLIGAGTNQTTISGAASGASNTAEWRQIGIQLGVGVLVMLLGTAVIKTIGLASNKAAEAYKAAKASAQRRAADAEKAADDPAAQERPAPAEDPAAPEAPANAPIEPVEPPVRPPPVDGPPGQGPPAEGPPAEGPPAEGPPVDPPVKPPPVEPPAGGGGPPIEDPPAGGFDPVDLCNIL